MEQLGLLWLKPAQTGYGLAVDLDAVLLDLAQQGERLLWWERGTRRLEPHPHHPMQR